MGNMMQRATEKKKKNSNRNDISAVLQTKNVETRVEIGALYENMPVLFALAGWVFTMLLFITTTTTCLGHSVDRVFGVTQNAKSLIVIADGGDQTFATGNTIEAYRAAMRYTQWLRISVYPVFRDNNTVDGEYYLLSDDTIHYHADGTINPLRCTAHSLDDSGLPRTTLAAALDFAVTYNATIILHHVPCVPYTTDDIVTVGSEPAAIVALHRYVVNTLAPAPASAYLLANIIYTYSDSATVDAMHRIYGLTRHTFMYEDGRESTVTMPFASSRGHEPSLSIGAISYDTWTCSRHVQVHKGTWLNLYNADAYLKKAIVYSAARSIQTIDPRTIVEYITSRGFHVVSSR